MKSCLAIVLCFLVLNLSKGDETPTKLKKDEEVILFPALGWKNPTGDGWFVEFHAWVYEKEPRRASTAMLQKLLGMKLEELSAEEKGFFKKRTGWFLVDNERGKNLSIGFNGLTIDLGKTDANGHAKGDVVVDWWLLNGLKKSAGQTNVPSIAGTNVVTLELAVADKRVIQGAVHIIGEEGWTVVSDIDDTIKVTEVRDREAMLRNTLCKEFMAAEGMAKMYTEWAGQGAVFHYVSASPWQLYPDLERFRAANGYPAGTFQLRQFRLKDGSGVEFLKGSGGFKPGEIGKLLERFPKRKFMLVGDSGEHDPEIYGELARKYPEQIYRILIRDVTGDRAEGERYRAAFQGVARGKWVVFGHPDEVKHLGPGKAEEKAR
ncbi:MAG TPA: App1 family protein [Verrucomicrobiae bacterium]